MQTQGKPAVRYGLIFGAVIAAIGIASTLLQAVMGTAALISATGTLTRTGAVTTLLGCVLFLVYLGLYFVAGMLTARRTGTVGSGAVAGLIAGALGGTIGGGVSLIIKLANPAPAALSQSGVSGSVFMIGVIIGVIFGIALDIGLGAGLGALGALAGRGQFRGPAQPYQEAMYQGFQQPGYPQYPQQGYPQPGAYPPPPGEYPAPPQPGAYPPSPAYPPQDPGQQQ